MKSNFSRITVAIVLVGIALVVYAVFQRSAAIPSPRILNLSEYGVALEIPGSLSDLTYAPHDESAKGPGTVLHMIIGTGCDIGAIYQIRKDSIAKSNTTWTQATLEQFALPQGTKPAQVKEFTDFYLVFEPNPNHCATDEAGIATETQKQIDFWNALVTARYMSS